MLVIRIFAPQVIFQLLTCFLLLLCSFRVTTKESQVWWDFLDPGWERVHVSKFQPKTVLTVLTLYNGMFWDAVLGFVWCRWSSRTKGTFWQMRTWTCALSQNVNILVLIHSIFSHLGRAGWIGTKRSRWSKGENYSLASRPEGARKGCWKSWNLCCLTGKLLLTGNGFQGIRGEPGELILSSQNFPWSTVGRRLKIIFTIAPQKSNTLYQNCPH